MFILYFVGGMPEVSQNSMQKFSTGFIGCIKDMMLAEEYQFSLVEKAQSGSNIEACTKSRHDI